MSPAPTAAAPGIDAETPVAGSLYGDGTSVMSRQRRESAIAANNAMIVSLSEAGITDRTVRNGLELCNSMYPFYHNRAKGEQSPSQATHFKERRLTLHELNTRCIRRGQDLLRDQESHMSGGSIETFETRLEKAKPSYMANIALYKQLEDWHPTEKGDIEKRSQYADGLLQHNASLDLMTDAWNCARDCWTEHDEDNSRQTSQEFKVDGQKLRAEIETFMQTVGAKSEERRASELKASNSQDRGQAD